MTLGKTLRIGFWCFRKQPSDQRTRTYSPFFTSLQGDREDCGWLSHQSEKAMAPHSSTLAWKIPWTEEPSRLQSMGLLRVGHDWATSLSLFTFMHWRRKWQPIPVFLPGESQGRGTLMGCIYGVAQSWTWPNWLSSSSSSSHQWPMIYSFVPP